MPTLFPSGLGDLGSWHIPEAWVPWMDCRGADRAGGDVLANEPCPMGLHACSPLHWPTISRSRAPYCTHRMWCLWAGRATNRPLGSMSPSVGVPTSSLLPRGCPTCGESTSQRVVLQELGCVQGVGVRKAGGMGHKPWVFLPALCSLDSPGTGLSLRLWFPQSRVAHKDMLPPCGHFHNNNFETTADGHLN